MESRRTQPRFERRLDVEAIVGAATYRGTTRDLSLGGLCMVMAAPLTFGQRVRLRFWLPAAKDAVEVDGEVRWSEGAAPAEQTFGLRFFGLRAKDVWAVGKYLQATPSGAGTPPAGTPSGAGVPPAGTPSGTGAPPAGTPSGAGAG
jgi:hypothetical protein